MRSLKAVKMCKNVAAVVVLFFTGPSLYAPYSLMLISNKFWMGGGWEVGGGDARGPSWRGRIRRVDGENKRGGTA